MFFSDFWYWDSYASWTVPIFRFVKTLFNCCAWSVVTMISQISLPFTMLNITPYFLASAENLFKSSLLIVKIEIGFPSFIICFNRTCPLVFGLLNAAISMAAECFASFPLILTINSAPSIDIFRSEFTAVPATSDSTLIFFLLSLFR